MEWEVKPCNKVDKIAAYHDICYDIGKYKGDYDTKMVESLDQIPYGKCQNRVKQQDSNTKQKLGLGNPKNGKRR